MLACSICNDPFRSVEELCAHLLFYHHLLKGGFFKCQQCERVIKTIGVFKRHLETVHAGFIGNELLPDNYVVNEAEVDPLDGAEEVIIHEVDADADDFDVNNFDVNNAADARFTLENFVNLFTENVQHYVAQLYAVPNMNRKQVNDIVQGTSALISSISVCLRDNVFKFISSFEDIPENFAHEYQKLDNMFSTLKDPFEFMTTEHQRFKSLQQDGFYIPPERFEMGHKDEYVKSRDNTVQLIRRPVYGQFVPLRHVLKCFLELPGVYHAILGYMEALENENNWKKRNFVQGSLWSNVSAPFKADGKIVLPLHLEFDDYEPDNALGSHHTEHSVGSLCVTIPCLPPEFQSALGNMFLFTVFESKYREEFGNHITFARAIEELTFLEQEGISVNIDDQIIKVYFCFCLIIADNKGNNSIQGFPNSFSANFYCRICKLHRTQMQRQCVPLDNYKRTIDNYAADVALNDMPATGVAEECVWNQVPSYHCVTSAYGEVMHDIYEGMLKYGICNCLFYIVRIRGYVPLDLLIDRINSFDYGPHEVSNKPTTRFLTLSTLENCSYNLSAAEMLCLARYLGEMIGDLVPENIGVWKFYILLREILSIICCPVFEDGIDIYLRGLVREHHEMYLRYFGELKPKHHFMIHYPELLKKNGPLVLISALKGERNHRRGRMYAHASNSRVNFALSVAIKFQLYLCERLMRNDIFTNVPETSKVYSTQIEFVENGNVIAATLNLNPTDNISTVKSAKVSGTLYTLGSVVVTRIGDLLPTFGKISSIILHDNNVYFVLNVLKTVDYINHICAFETEATCEVLCIAQKNLLYFAPLWQRKIGSILTVSLKHSL